MHMAVANVDPATQEEYNLRSIDSNVLAKALEHTFIRAQPKDVEHQLRDTLSQALTLDLVEASNNLQTLSLCQNLHSRCGELTRDTEIHLLNLAKRNISIEGASHSLKYEVEQIWTSQIKSPTP